MRRLVKWAIVSVLVATFACAPISYGDTQPKNKGLFITPLRSYINTQPKQTKNGTFTIINITDKPIMVTLSVEQFSVADYTYDYAFMPVSENWVKLETTQAQLQPNKSQEIHYAIDVPANVSPGGHYFTIFASTSLHNGAVDSIVRAATVLYVTVDGDLHRTSEIENETIPWVSFGGDIPFSLDIKNTGNTHFFVYVSGKLSGLSAKPDTAEVTHILLPGTIRTAAASIAAPLLPGIYKATYGYKTDTGQVITRSRFVAYIPPWSLAIPIGGIWLAIILVRHRKNVAFKKQ